MVLGTILLTSRREMDRRTEAFAVAFYEVTLVLFFVPGFFFTGGGGFPSSAIVSVNSVSCNSSTLVCNVILVNTGTAETSVLGCNLIYGGTSFAGSVRGDGARSVPAPGQAVAICDVSGASSLRPPAGSSLTGSLTMSNGATIPFTGVWS
jgi:hypothetical protein